MMSNLRPKKLTGPPTKVTMKGVDNPLLHRILQTYVPFSLDDTELRKLPDFHPEDLLVLPGVHVKAAYGSGGATLFGRVVKFMGEPLELGLPDFEEVSDDVVIISSDSSDVWVGPFTQYFEMWCVD